jgi:hypothetical protein
MVSDIPAGDGKAAKICYSVFLFCCLLLKSLFHPFHPPSLNTGLLAHISYNFYLVSYSLSLMSCHLSRFVSCHLSLMSCHLSRFVSCHLSLMSCHLSLMSCHLSRFVSCHLSPNAAVASQTNLSVIIGTGYEQHIPMELMRILTYVKNLGN